MPTDVIMPQMGESIFEGTITKWLKKPGDRVQRDEPLFEISTDKVDAEIPAPASGVLKEVRVAEGATVQVNSVVGVIDEAGAAAAAQPAAPKAEPTQPAKAAAQTTGGAANTEGATPPKPAAQADGAPAPAPAGAPAQAQTGGGAQAGGGDGGPGTDIVMPQMGESIFEGTITKWLKQVGDKVTRDEPLFEISTDKVDAEIPAPASGVLSEIRVPAGATVQVNSVVGVIGGGASAKAGAGAPAQQPAAQQPAGQPSTAPASRPSPVGETEIDTTARDRKDVEPAAQAKEQQAVAEGPRQVIDLGGGEATGERIRSSPLVRKIAKENNVNLAQVPGTGMGGRITRDDILNFVQRYGKGGAPAAQAAAQQPRPAAPPAQSAAPATPRAAAPAAPAHAATPGEVVPMSAMRKKIAERMVESKRTSAHVHTVFKVDMTRIERIRQKQKASFEQRNGVKLTYLPFVARAAMAGFKAMPIVNSSVEGDSIRYHKHVNLGIAVALDWGLIVPVVKQAEEKSFVGLARAFADLGERARSKKLVPDDVAGGTFTITNPGIFGPQFGTPIIAQPQVAILGMGGVFKEPVVITDEDGNDSIAIRHIIRLTLGYDHRIIDGADADRFMVAVKKYLESWNEEIG